MTHGREAIVDDADFDFLSFFKWHATETGYAKRNVRTHGGGYYRMVCMHDYILLPDPGIYVDHINSDRLDNRRANLRLCSHAENIRNQSMKSNNTSGYKGVCWDSSVERWRTTVTKDGRKIYIGVFVDAHAAALAYDEAALFHFGEFAKTNASIGVI